MLENTAKAALKELGFFEQTSEYCWADLDRPKELHEKEIKELSGGWLYRLKLASTLLSRPDLLIIDEPSFLDEQGTQWLINFLKEELLPYMLSDAVSKSIHRFLLSLRFALVAIFFFLQKPPKREYLWQLVSSRSRFFMHHTHFMNSHF